MQVFQGHLLVEEIRGRKGPFCVGTLHLSIGDFKVKDAALDQFKPGSYSGSFTVEKIFTKGVPWRGGFFTELIAKIAPDGFLIDDETASPEPHMPQQAEPDPVDDGDSPASHAATASASAAPAPRGRAAVSAAANEPPVHDDATLFGVEIFALFEARSAEIALDPTVDRELFRRQRDRLKASGYRFDSKGQRWVLPS